MSSAGKRSLLADLKEFVLRGNVIDLAVTIVIGAAFSSVVNSVDNGLINPLVGAFGTKDRAGYSSCPKGPCGVNDKGDVTNGIHILWSSVLSAALTFPITAALVYFLMVLPMARYLARRAARHRPVEEVEPVSEEAEETMVLHDIRDALVAPRSGGTG
ncbi:large conductance mechanosensitive channel protein MscL [Streptomyces sp. NBC_01198]|uniref:large conductance mechanosensitive channel protein MscL n=1 Tax=Streptomyces sp. NBC_01198 TaxID=2903769 RepID=UPI002E162C89|nr:MscL family protein [Streptomyces sp. NBC_01198]